MGEGERESERVSESETDTENKAYNQRVATVGLSFSLGKGSERRDWPKDAAARPVIGRGGNDVVVNSDVVVIIVCSTDCCTEEGRWERR